MDASTPVGLEAIGDPRLRKLVAIWNRMRGERSMPHPADISLRDLKDFASRLWIWECTERDPERYRVLVYGSRIMLSECRDLTGMRLSEMPFSKPYRDLLKQDYAAVVASSVPAFHQVMTENNGNPHPYSRVILPVGMVRTSHLMVCSQLPEDLRIEMTAPMVERLRRRALAERYVYSRASIAALERF